MHATAFRRENGRGAVSTLQPRSNSQAHPGVPLRSASSCRGRGSWPERPVRFPNGIGSASLFVLNKRNRADLRRVFPFGGREASGLRPGADIAPPASWEERESWIVIECGWMVCGRWRGGGGSGAPLGADLGQEDQAAGRAAASEGHRPGYGSERYARRDRRRGHGSCHESAGSSGESCGGCGQCDERRHRKAGPLTDGSPPRPTPSHPHF